MKKFHRHEPPHIYADDTWYFITASTFRGVHFLATHQAKTLLLEKIRDRTQEYGIQLKAWVILNNHYHLLMKSRRSADIPRFFQRLHAGMAFELNNLENRRGRKIWYSYWDTCIRDDRGFWTRFNYIHNNPVKHGYVRLPGDWEFSSYHEHLWALGKGWLLDRFRAYPVLSYVDEGEALIEAVPASKLNTAPSG